MHVILVPGHEGGLYRATKSLAPTGSFVFYCNAKCNHCVSVSLGVDNLLKGMETSSFRLCQIEERASMTLKNLHEISVVGRRQRVAV